MNAVSFVGRVSLARAPSTLTRCATLRTATGYSLRTSTAAFSTSRPRLGPELTKDLSRQPELGLKGGTEGLHKHDLPTSIPPATTEHTDALARQHHGDWVLFHPVYTKKELEAVRVLTHERATVGDKLAGWFVKALRRGFDIVSRYKHNPMPPNASTMTLEQLRKGGHVMDESQWLMRILFLETIAGVPGFTAAMIRHLRSLRIMKRDGGWIHMLLEEAENERMHLMTFMTLKEPSIWFRALILGAQGVFANAFFFAYLISPKVCHRFVGVLEEEATLTYTRLIEEMKAGYLPGWQDKPAPAIAIDYWRLNKDAKLLDVIYAVRSDESTHRFVNHTLANLNPKEDINPFALGEPDMLTKGTKAGFSREEAAEYMRNIRKRAEEVATDSLPSSS